MKKHCQPKLYFHQDYEKENNELFKTKYTSE